MMNSYGRKQKIMMEQMQGEEHWGWETNIFGRYILSFLIVKFSLFVGQEMPGSKILGRAILENTSPKVLRLFLVISGFTSTE